MAKTIIKTDDMNTFLENSKSVHDGLYNDISLEDSLTSKYSDIIACGLVPTYLNNLQTNTTKIYTFLLNLSNDINGYKDEIETLELNISSNVAEKINSDLQIVNLSFFSVSISNKVKRGLEQLAYYSTSISALIYGNLPARNETLLNYASEDFNATKEEILSGGNEEALIAYLDSLSNLEDSTGVLNNLDEKTLQTVLRDIYFNKHTNFSDIGAASLVVLFGTLENAANSKNIKLEDLLNNEENAPLLKQYVTDVNKSLDKEEINLESSINDYAKETGTTAKGLTSGAENKELTSYVIKLDNVKDIVIVIKELDSKNIQPYLMELYNSGNINKSPSLSTLFEYLKLVSQKNSVSIDTLLQDKQYIDEIINSFDELIV